MFRIERGAWGPKSFATVSEIEEYLRRQREFYVSLRGFMPNSQGQFGQLDQALSYLDASRNRPDQAALYEQNALHSAAAVFSNGSGLVPSDTADGEFIDSFRPNAELAGKVAAQLAAPPNSTTEHQAALIVTAYRYPNMAGTKGFSFANTVASKMKTFEAEVARSEAVRIKLSEDAKSVLGVANEAHIKQTSDIQKAANEQREDIQKSWNELKDVYDAQLALQAPRTYWERQKSEHLVGAKNAKDQFRRAGMGAVIAATAILIFIWATTASKSADIPVALWLLSGAILGTAFWVMRLYSRLYLSREHLARDAEERVTMIETYLALVQHGRVKEDDLKFVLASIFRPTEDGLVRDDSLPSPLLDLFQQGKGKG